MNKGFYITLGRKEIFVVSDYTNKTDQLAEKILRKLINYGYDIPINPDTKKELLYWTTPATIEYKDGWRQINGIKSTFIVNSPNDSNLLLIELNK